MEAIFLHLKDLTNLCKATPFYKYGLHFHIISAARGKCRMISVGIILLYKFVGDTFSVIVKIKEKLC